MLEILEIQAKTAKESTTLPSWVSEKNLSSRAYAATMQLMDEKLLYIQSKKNLSDFRVKRQYQISAAELARCIGVSTSTITSKSSYSNNLTAFLNDVNRTLIDKKNEVLRRHQKTLDSGVKQRKKNQILLELHSTKLRLESLQMKNAEVQVRLILNALSNPVKIKLGIDV